LAINSVGFLARTELLKRVTGDTIGIPRAFI